MFNRRLGLDLPVLLVESHERLWGEQANLRHLGIYTGELKPGNPDPDVGPCFSIRFFGDSFIDVKFD